VSEGDTHPLQRRADATAAIQAAFAAVGVDVGFSEAMRLGEWVDNIESRVRFQDLVSAEHVRAIRDAALQLINAISAASELSDEDDGARVNVWPYVFDYDEDRDFLQLNLALLVQRTEMALGMGQQPQGRGRPPNVTYTAFVRELHDLYVSKTGERGFYRTTSGSASGPFVDLTIEAQKILPIDLRLNERSTIANRILSAIHKAG
jgi:hypothetical protein